MTVEQRIKSLGEQIDSLQLELARQETIMQQAKERRAELIEALQEKGYKSFDEIPAVLDEIDDEIEEHLARIERGLAGEPAEEDDGEEDAPGEGVDELF